MTRRLLDRQSSLIHYLTSGAAIFDDSNHRPVDPALQGFDRRLLGLEARFSYEKRMEKIAAVFPRTLELLDADQDTLFREFVETYPPFAIGRLENAHQFYDFLSARWRQAPAKPQYLPDVAACELAFAAARVVAEDRPSDDGNSPTRAPRAQVRRSPAIVLLRCTHDIRPLFDKISASDEPIARDLPLAIVARAAGTDLPDIFELMPEVFDLLGSLGDWVDQDVFAEWEDARKLLAELAAAGLVETRP